MKRSELGQVYEVESSAPPIEAEVKKVDADMETVITAHVDQRADLKL